MRHDLTRLASDEMEGRRVGTPGLLRATRMLEQRFAAIGLAPSGDDGYRQGFRVTVGTDLGSGNRMTLTLPGGQVRELQVETDFLPLSFSDSGNVNGAEVVFAGYGIQAPDLGYDDYDGLDVGGKLVLILRDEPQENEEDSPFAGKIPSSHSNLRFKAVTARERGAAGILLITGPLYHADEVDDLLPLRNDFSGADHGLPAVSLKLAVVRPLLEAAGIDLEDWQRQVDHTLTPEGAPLPGLRVDLQTDLRKTHAETWNVVGRVTGGGRSDEVVVVGAHYDHLGLGGPGSLTPDRFGEVHNGADDNASGIAALLAVAEAVRRRPQPLQRTVVFAAFSGEEEGLLGSSHYVRHPPQPLSDHVFMLNMDMVGRLQDQRLVISGLGTGTGLEDLAAAAAGRAGLDFSRDASGYGASDQTVFYAREIPVLFLFTGAHSEYHRPEDDADLIDYRGLRRVARLAYLLVEEIANLPAGPEYRKVAGAKPVTSGGGRGYGPYFGSIPDFGESPVPGVLLSGVREGSPAGRAGVRGGDTVVEFGGVKVENLHDYTFALRKHRPGDEVEVVVVRDGERLTFTAVLQKRK